jgi:hypothetical protein
MRVPGLLLTAVLWLLPGLAFALPQFAVRSSRMCSNCHVDPEGWENPDLSERKCSLSCQACHLNPTGAGMRNAAGRYYGREILPMFGERPGQRPRPASAPFGPGPASRPAESAMHRAPSFTASIRPDQLPALALLGAVDEAGPVPPAGHPWRYAEYEPAGWWQGLHPRPWWQVGADARLMLYAPQGDGQETSFFPMQTDLYLAASPYNPEAQNEGRLTVLVNMGSLGSRGQEFDGFTDRLFVREWWALFHDLPYQLYAKAGRFLPAYGWRLDDHSALIRQPLGFDHERQVTGLELGLNPNYLYAHASVYNPATDWMSPFDGDAGIGTALSAGWRDLLWQAGGSLAFEARDDASELWVGAQWALNLFDATGAHAWKGLDWVPLVYLGEVDLRLRDPKEGRAVTSLASFHELDWLIVEGLNAKLRHDWIDPDLELRDDHVNRYTIGLEFHPITFVELIAQLRYSDLAAGGDLTEIIAQLHLWY